MESNKYFEDAKRNMQNRVGGLSANSVGFFAETNTPNGGSNDPSHLEEVKEEATRRMSRLAPGQQANDISFFAHTGEKNKSSNDKDYVESMVDVALGTKKE